MKRQALKPNDYRAGKRPGPPLGDIEFRSEGKGVMDTRTPA